uniref:Palmitoyltransferase n=1 Tax=Romanomermis culicivorax TaxID=13658 RepID=A0A915HIJ1_ROMCU
MLNLPTNINRQHELPNIQYRQYSDQISYSCCGFLYIGPQNGVFYLTLFLICGTMGLFFGFDAPYLTKNVSVFIPLMAGFILLLVLSCLLRCAFMDPGIIPRSTMAEFNHLERELNSQFPRNQGEPGACASTSTLAAQKTKEICINGQVVTLKYCPTCRIYRPPRSSHCSICDSCILRFDHHCPWVGNCVGLRNYRYFYLFLVLLSLLCVYVFFCVVVHLVE